MPQFPEEFFIKKNNPKEQTESFPETKEKEALELIREIKDLMNKPETERTPEDYQRITELCKEIESLFSPKRNPIGIELIPNAEVEVGRGVVGIAISSDGNFVVIGNTDKKIVSARIIKDSQGNPIGMELIPNTEVVVEGWIRNVAISPDESFVIIVSSGKKIGLIIIKIIKDSGGNPIEMRLILYTEVGFEGWVESAAISPDGKFVIIANKIDKKIVLVRIIKDSQGNPIGIKLIPNAEVEVGGVESIAISPDGNCVVIGSEDGKARLAKIIKDDQGNPIGMELIPDAVVDVGEKVVSIAISPDGNFVVITSEDGKVRLAKIIKDDQGNPIGMELIPDAVITVEGGVLSIALSPDGNSVVIGRGDGKVELARIIFEEQE